MWNDEKIISELKQIITDIGHFPTREELDKMGKGGLRGAIATHGGFNKIRALLGYKKYEKPNGYWTDETIICELESITNKLDNFPTQIELGKMKRSDLITAMQNQGGSNKFRNLLGYDLIQKSPGYWTDEIIIDELKTIIARTGNFPSGNELKKIGRGDLVRGINRHGGFNKFRASLKCKLLKQSNGYWTEERIIGDLNKIVTEIGYFPTQTDLNNLGNKDLVAAISVHGGLSKFRKEMGHELLVKPDGYWDNENNITNELKIIITKIGHFPTQPELKELDKQDLSQAIRIHGGSDKFRKLLGCELLKKPLGYWTNDVIINELKAITDNLGYFPTCNELRDMGRSDLETQINVLGGILMFQ